MVSTNDTNIGKRSDRKPGNHKNKYSYVAELREHVSIQLKTGLQEHFAPKKLDRNCIRIMGSKYHNKEVKEKDYETDR
jgi:hypothetical protein